MRDMPPSEGNYQDAMMQAVGDEQMGGPPQDVGPAGPPQGQPPAGGGDQEAALREQLSQFIQVLPKELQAMFSMESVQEALMTLDPDDFNEFFLTLLQQADLADPNATPVQSELSAQGDMPQAATEPAGPPDDQQGPGYEDMMMEQMA